ncbi:integrase catalytic domain-containing protein [Trichonephila clavata]|uniref:Integrase catalytic domain-containing protein n=1 Tax=Trichonephila clavata TaxID=2740835 RepID=A0A8X6H007_TRICU|nr:integrase catalytic domain-containing protein [Trichonephila clavata]
MTSNCTSLIVTKKSVISTIARIFDPLGLIGPEVTRAKIFLQSLWQLKLDWNDALPSNLVSYWKSYIDALESINCLNIPRYCLQDKSIRTELHGFSDSSEKAYGAALYLRCIDSSGQISVRLLCSKSKVAPLKSVVIKLLPGKDGINRLVRLRTTKRELLRPVQRIFPLEISKETFRDDVLKTKSAEATLANIRNSFWIPSARNVVRKILRTASPVERLQQRPTRCKGKVGFKEGDFVLVKPSENSDTLKWHLARILKLHPGKDNLVRVVTLKDKQGVYKRPVTKIANLPYVN